jgi:16S rRNA processing protein RimM
VSPTPERVAVGRITRAHGIHGAVAILRLTDVDERFDQGSRLLLGPEGDRVMTVADRRGHRDRPLVRFEGIRDRTQAESLAGSYLFVPAADAPALPAGEYWEHELLGMHVVTEGGRSLGEVTQVLRTTANDLWVATSPEGTETLVPALKEVVISVDRNARRIRVAEIPGLTAPEDDRPEGRVR